MMKKLFTLFLVFPFLAACGASTQSRRGPVTPKPFVTPWQYYQKTKPAHLTDQDEVKVQKAAMDTFSADTNSDKRGIIIIGVLVGVMVVGGAVTAIALTR